MATKHTPRSNTLPTTRWGTITVRLNRATGQLVPCIPAKCSEPYIFPHDVVGGFAVWSAVGQRLLGVLS